MTEVEVATLPPTVRALVDAALAVGWKVRATYADVDDVRSIAVRFASPVGEYRAFAVWKLGLTPKGALAVGFERGAARHVPPGSFGSLAGLKRYLGVG